MQNLTTRSNKPDFLYRQPTIETYFSKLKLNSAFYQLKLDTKTRFT